MLENIKLHIDKIINVLSVLLFIGGVIGTIYCIYQGNDYDDSFYFIALIVFVSTLVCSVFMIGFSELIASTRKLRKTAKVQKNKKQRGELNRLFAFYSPFILRSADKCYRKGAEHCNRNADRTGLKWTCNNSQKAVFLYRFLYTFCK